MLKKFDTDAIATFCWRDKKSRAAEKKKNHGDRFNNKIDREYPLGQ